MASEYPRQEANSSKSFASSCRIAGRRGESAEERGLKWRKMQAALVAQTAGGTTSRMKALRPCHPSLRPFGLFPESQQRMRWAKPACGCSWSCTAASVVTSKKEGGRRRKKEGVGRGKKDREGGEGRRKDTERKTEREPHGCQTLGSGLDRSCYKHATGYCTIIYSYRKNS